jgi:pimeloyl-ACP methyl ester carboxylesterase
MAARNPAMRTISVPRVGHAPTLDEPEVRAAIRELLDEVA